jgi:inward rectifier potassium channel
MVLRRKTRRPRKIHITRQDDGQFQIQGVGAWYQYWRDPYHLMLTVPWWGFIGIIGFAYLAINALFALLYLLGGDCLEGARPGSFEDAFFFSVHTLASIGYGVIAPKTTYANLVVTLEAITSLLSIAVVTGLAFARFSKPTARVLFSRHAVIMPYNKVPTLMFRMANERGNRILEATVQLYLLQNEMTEEGDFFYRVHTLDLIRHVNPNFMLSWTVMHPITRSSPLFSATPEELGTRSLQLIVSLTGTDETVADQVHVRHQYGASQIRFDHRFIDVVHPLPNGDRYFLRDHFHDVEPLKNKQ